MTPGDNPAAGAVIIVTFIAIAALLLIVLVGSTIRQQRRYLRTRQNLGGRLLTAQDEERAAIARELHGDIVQRIAGCATRLHEVDAPAAVAITDDLEKLADIVRGLARGMHPAIVEQLGLSAALAELCRVFEAREGVKITYDGPADRDALAPNQRLGFYRIAQEALGNVARHARIDHAQVRLTCDDNGATLVIEDQGAGFDPRRTESGPGIGVTSMRERLAILGGALDIKSSLGTGTRVTAFVPAQRVSR